jgi:hypothetical protein
MLLEWHRPEVVEEPAPATELICSVAGQKPLSRREWHAPQVIEALRAALPKRTAATRRPDAFLDTVFEHQKLSAGERLLLRAVARHANWENGECWPGTDCLCAETGYGEATIRRLKAKLIDRRLLSSKGRALRKGRGRTTSVLTLVGYREWLGDLSINDLPINERSVGPTTYRSSGRPTDPQVIVIEEEHHLERQILPPPPQRMCGGDIFSQLAEKVPNSERIIGRLLRPLIASIELKASDPVSALALVAEKFRGQPDAVFDTAREALLRDRTHNVNSPMIDKALAIAATASSAVGRVPITEKDQPEQFAAWLEWHRSELIARRPNRYDQLNSHRFTYEKTPFPPNAGRTSSAPPSAEQEAA